MENMNNDIYELKNEKLDTIALMLIDCYNEIIEQRELLNTSLDDAYLNLSRARSLVGCSSLSIMQVPFELEPNVTVNSNTTQSCCLDSLQQDIKYNETKFDLIIQTKQKTSDNSNVSKPMPAMPTWFGVLTPFCLKTSHKSFSESLYIIKTLCELQTKLFNLQTLYSDLKKEII
jgi:hypothetical protein